MLSTTGAALFDGMGGINLENARIVCETLGYAWDEVMMRKITQAAAAYLKGTNSGR